MTTCECKKSTRERERERETRREKRVKEEGRDPMLFFSSQRKKETSIRAIRL
jgi:hypothetical protein